MSDYPEPQDCWCGEAQAGLCPTPERCGERAVAAQEYGRKLLADRSARSAAIPLEGGTMQAVCLHRNGFGQYCERRNGHTGSCRHRMFSREDAQRAYQRLLHVGDPRWTWEGNGWLTTDPELVDEAMERLEASKGLSYV